MKQWSLVLCGIDLNGRLPGHHDCVTGELESDEPDATGRMFAEILGDNGVWVPSTFGALHTGDSATYTHSSGAESRIDFLLLGGAATVEQVGSAVNAAIDNGSPNLDHKAVTLQLRGSLGRPAPRPRLQRLQFDREAMATDEGRKAVAHICQTFSQPAWDVHPDEHCRRLEEHLQTEMEKWFPKQPGPGRASFIPDDVWRMRQFKNQLKWRTRGRLQMWKRLLGGAVAHWRQGAVPHLEKDIHRQHVLYHVVAGAIKFASSRIRRSIAQAKDAFLRKVATEGDQGVSAILNRAKRAGIGARARAPVRRELPKLLNPTTGCEAESAADRDDIWLQFFGEQEAGRLLSTEDFIQAAALTEPTDRPHWEWGTLPSQHELAGVLRRIPKNKAAGLDHVPSDLLRACPSDFAGLLQPLFVKSLLLGRQPLQWRGGVLFEMYKQSGAQCEAASHRSIYISSFIAKALHRVMRNKVAEETEAFLHPLHCGTRPGMPVLFPSLFVLEHLRKCQSRGLCAAIVYLDTKAAYYRLVRQLATGDLTVDQHVEELFRRFGLDSEDMTELRDLILSGGMLQAANIPDAIRAAVSDFHCDTWFTTRFTDGRTLRRSTAGSRPGASWADCVFAFIYARILFRVHEVLEGEGINFDLPLDEATGIFPPEEESSRHQAWDTTWADDSAYALQAADAEQLLCRTERLGALVISEFRSHGLDPNLKRHKTSIMLSLRGAGSKTVRRRCFADGRSELRLRDLAESIPIVLHYKHLGCILDPLGKLGPEARHRTALATAAYDSARDLLLQNRDLSLSTRTALFRTTVLASYFNLEVWLAKGKAWDGMSDAFSRLVRRLLCRLVPGKEVYKIPTPLAHLITGCWPLEMFARRSRVSALVSLARKGPPILWAAIQAEGEWSAQLCQDLAWLVVGDEKNWPEVSTAAWPQWWHLLRGQAGRVKQKAAKRNAESLSATSVRLSRNFVCGTFTVACLYLRELLATMAVGGAECVIKPSGPRPTWRCICSRCTTDALSTGSTSLLLPVVPAARSSGRLVEWRTI